MKRVPYADEAMSLEDPSEDLDALIMEARGVDKQEAEDESENTNGMEVSFNKTSLQDYLICRSNFLMMKLLLVFMLILCLPAAGG